MSDRYNIYLGDCIDILSSIPKGCIDMVLCDPPFGTINEKWDVQLPFERTWELVNHAVKKNAAILIFGQEPFSSHLRISNESAYRYDYVWEKERFSNVLCVKKMPGKIHENIMVFYYAQPTYNPQMTEHKGPRIKPNKPKNGIVGSVICSSGLKVKPYEDNGYRYPTTIIQENRDILAGRYHPTQKPVRLLERLILTYTNIGETVLDFCMGSGSCGVAAINTGRRFIGIEKNEVYFETARKRIEEAVSKPKQDVFAL